MYHYTMKSLVEPPEYKYISKAPVFLKPATNLDKLDNEVNASFNTFVL